MADLPGPPEGEEAVEPPRDDAHERARKINPLYADGPLVRVGWAGNQAEAELIQGMLLEQGVPSTLRRSIGFDVPDFLAAGPRDVFVPETGAERARELLGATGMAPPQQPGAGPGLGQAARIAAVLVIASGGLFVIAWLLRTAG